jgi:hypothetical protein
LLSILTKTRQIKNRIQIPLDDIIKKYSNNL